MSGFPPPYCYTAHHRSGEIGHPKDWTLHINLWLFLWTYLRRTPIPIISHKSVGPECWNVWWTDRGYVPMSDHKHSGLCSWSCRPEVYILSMWGINHESPWLILCVRRQVCITVWLLKISPKLLTEYYFVHHSTVNWYANALVSLILSKAELNFHSLVATVAAAIFVY